MTRCPQQTKNFGFKIHISGQQRLEITWNKRRKGDSHPGEEWRGESKQLTAQQAIDNTTDIPTKKEKASKGTRQLRWE